MATVVWDAKGVILVDYLEKGNIINGQYLATMLEKLNEEIKVKRPHLAKKKPLCHQDESGQLRGWG